MVWKCIIWKIHLIYLYGWTYYIWLVVLYVLSLFYYLHLKPSLKIIVSSASSFVHTVLVNYNVPSAYRQFVAGEPGRTWTIRQGIWVWGRNWSRSVPDMRRVVSRPGECRLFYTLKHRGQFPVIAGSTWYIS